MKFFIDGRIKGLNAIINANRSNKYAGASLKKDITEALAWQIKGERLSRLDGLRHYRFTWYEPNRRRDPDNVASAIKFVLDAMQQAGIIENDGWKQVQSIHHEFIRSDSIIGVEVEVTPV